MSEARLIDANALIKEAERLIRCEMEDGHEHFYRINAVEVAAINAAPTIDAKPVRHGRWEKIDTTVEQVWRCSICGYPCGIWTAGSKYCPHCGAKMAVEHWNRRISDEQDA